MPDWLPGVLVALVTGGSTIIIGLFTRLGSKEANDNSREGKFIEGLQKQLETERSELAKCLARIEKLEARVNVLEAQGRRWRYWAQRVVPLLQEGQIQFPPTPQGLEDTDPNLRSATT